MTSAADLESVFRTASGQAVATLARSFGDLDRAEDAVQDAFVTAMERWPDEGLPLNPAGWIVTTARHRAIDHLRRSSRGHELLREVATLTPGETELELQEDDVVPDDQLRLIFTCCHPSIRLEDQVALTLRLLGGLEVDDVARAFVVSEAAMAKRLTRAKYKIKAARIPYRIPEGPELPDRLPGVLAVVYLIHTTGIADSGRGDLLAEATRLGRVLTTLMPDEPEVVGLLALMLFGQSRVPARWDETGVVPLRDQDRRRWDRDLIDEATGLVRALLRRNQPGPYQLQAAIQAVHASAEHYEDTDWGQIVALYDQLLGLSPTPVIALNRAVAVGEVDGPDAALALLDELSGLDGHHLIHAVRGEMLDRLGRPGAKIAWTRAAALAPTDAERRFAEGRAHRTPA